MSNARLDGFWGSLTTALKTGKPQNESRYEADDLVTALYAEPDRLKAFLSVMSGISLGPTPAIAAKFTWAQHKTFIDCGCAQGMVAVTPAKAYPHLIGGGLDLPQVRPIFEEFVARHGLAERLTFNEVDF